MKLLKLATHKNKSETPFFLDQYLMKVDEGPRNMCQF